MFAFKKMCHLQKYNTQILVLSYFFTNNWLAELFDPLAQFPYLFNTLSFWCSTCLEDADNRDMKSHSFLSRTNHWFNGQLKRYKPWLLYHTNSCNLLVSCMYRCSKGYKVSSCHPYILSNFPSPYHFQIPFCLFHRIPFISFNN